MSAAADVLSAICLLLGAALSLAAGIGLLRFPDLLSRMHAASKPQVLGLLLILTGVGLRLRTGIDVTTLVLVAIFQLMTAPVAAHMVARAAYRTRRVRRDLLIVDELSERLDEATASSRDDDAERGRD
ncbi:Na(+) H(+) antiporter subunit G [Patulibacter medicamentivorans]|uniref:Na(+) H(+) antiporter subunit G n=1 Tax=Patulibacter medicamentivorans TaxID=1097667 RepID=H0E4P1_9ACTN|nr:monovalent cation/H(+) antiporter subunit G [Patulibacter medicamentivorans]EHN11354.1 Na(+) H(+) antiporter subunit G [Patulibacter medicamentivorans]